MVRLQAVTKPPPDSPAQIQRAKERLYVSCQVGGWGFFLGVQLYFSRAFADGLERGEHDQVSTTAVYTLVMLLGLLLTHCARFWMTRWGWKQMGWLALVPRIMLMAAGLAFLWSVLNYGYTFGILNLPRPTKYSMGQIFFLGWLNQTGLVVGWQCIYFFYHTLDRVQRMQVEQFRLAANVKEAELRALKSQVNPHFLFNSLNSLRALIDEDAPRAREAVTRLANILRYSLQSGQLEVVSLKDELRAVEDYLALEQIRHESRLTVGWDIDDLARYQPIPPMLLQTLVENAVKYGISTRRDGGTILISARIESSTLHIRVSNPGDLTSPANESSAKAGSSTGVGLRNASERLQLLYGDKATLRLVAEPVGCVTAHVTVPFKSPPA